VADTEFRIESAVGTLELVSTPGGVGPFRLMAGTKGLGLPAEILLTKPSASGGGWYRGHKVGMRTGTLVIEVRGESRTQTENRLRLLAAHVDADNSPVLVAVIPGDGTYRLPFYRDGGGEAGYTQWGDKVTEVAFEVVAPQPYWVRDEPVQFSVSLSDEEQKGLLPDLAELPVMSSDAYGELVLDNPGDVRAPIFFRITGPGGPVTVTVDGRGFQFLTPLAEGEVVTIERTPQGWRVRDTTGTNRYGDLAPAPKFPYAPRGVSTGVVVLQDAGEGASIAGWFNPMRKLVY